MAIKVVDIISVSSAAQQLLRNRVSMMRASGVDNRIICIDGPFVRTLRADGIPVHTVSLPRNYNVFKSALAFFQIAAYLRRERIDLVHTHSSIPGFIGRLAAWAARVPVVIHTVHGFHFHDGSSKPTRLLFAWLERVAGSVTDMLLSQNKADMEEARRYRIVSEDRLRHIGNGIDLEQFDPMMRQPVADGNVTITCVARFEGVKNHPMLFQAVRLLKERGERFRVWLIGEGHLQGTYEGLCARTGIDEFIRFLGYRNDVPALLAQTDIGVLTSFKEGIPRALLETMAMGSPVVATRVKGTQEVVQDGLTGFLVDLGDAEALAARLAELIHDPMLRETMGRRAREAVVAEFDERGIVDALRDIYFQQLRDKGVKVVRALSAVGERSR
ncbi:MAG: glycosyltransferase family 4 protein [Nitrospirae bacterium]|nr:glycosyltransferase family 4 protein [Nitrospirota bacterium]